MFDNLKGAGILLRDLVVFVIIRELVALIESNLYLITDSEKYRLVVKVISILDFGISEVDYIRDFCTNLREVKLLGNYFDIREGKIRRETVANLIRSLSSYCIT